ncbi:MAG: ABC transporter permease [Planctomycetes bacterium]|nr:ABC transporter permease [Planctomycetota bacterium]
MNSWRLIWNALWFHRRTNLGVLLGAAIAATTLIGALLVGDSVSCSLRDQAAARIGRVEVALPARDRFFLDSLSEVLRAEVPDATFAAALQLSGSLSKDGGRERLNRVQILGVDSAFFELAPEVPTHAPAPGKVWVDARVAESLALRVGDVFLVLAELPSAMPRDMVLAQTEELARGLRVEVERIVEDSAFGRFDLASSQVPPRNVFVDRTWLATELDMAGRANLMLARGEGTQGQGGAFLQTCQRALRDHWRLVDGELELVAFDDLGVCDLRSRRIFLDEPVAAAASTFAGGTLDVLTYFVNELKRGDATTPYSMVTAVGAPRGWPEAWKTVVPTDLAEDELVATPWLADDLQAKVGDEVKLTYYVMGPFRRLIEESKTFRLRAIVPQEGVADDRTLMPDFPGLSDSEHCRDWEPGIPIDMQRIRKKDEDYWDAHKGTPKAYVSLAAGRAMWGNRFGSLTAARVPRAQRDAFEVHLRERIDPASLGLQFVDVRERAFASANAATDFGGLFLGLSFFLILAALILTAMLFLFSVEQRQSEIGLLLSLGYRIRTVRWLLLAEASLLAGAGSLLGVIAGIGYTRGILHGLATIWKGAVASAALTYHMQPMTLVIGVIASVLTSLLAIAWALRRIVKRLPVDLLKGVEPSGARGKRRSWQRPATVIALVLGLAVVGFAWGRRGPEAAGAFFGAGSLILIAALLFVHDKLRANVAKPDVGLTTFAQLARREPARRPGRSLATVALLASGCFLVIAVGAQRQSAGDDPTECASGTGGFTLIGEASVPVPHDLNTPEGREVFVLSETLFADVSFVPFRVHAGDEASCLNLSTPKEPRLLGVDPEMLASRGAFVFADTLEPTQERPWDVLKRADDSNVVPAIGDQASVTWSMKKSLGDTFRYRDERGREFQVRIVATLQNSILQGNLIIAESHFERLFPSASGYPWFLIDAPLAHRDEIAQELGKRLRDVGFATTHTEDRLQDYLAVQNTYLAVFQVLGALGLLLGSLGLFMVVLRNVLERRAELAVLGAIGFCRKQVRRLVLKEHVLLLLLGLASGVFASVIAVLPAFRSRAMDFPFLQLGALILALFALGWLWVFLASWQATRGSTLEALQRE